MKFLKIFPRIGRNGNIEIIKGVKRRAYGHDELKRLETISSGGFESQLKPILQPHPIQTNLQRLLTMIGMVG